MLAIAAATASSRVAEEEGRLTFVYRAGLQLPPSFILYYLKRKISLTASCEACYLRYVTFWLLLDKAFMNNHDCSDISNARKGSFLTVKAQKYLKISRYWFKKCI